jgi:calcineurin-like phosphoesterase family protein
LIILPSDDVLFLGDLAMAGKEQTVTYFNKLNGNIVFISSNHNEKKLDTETHVYDSIEFSHNGIVYVCTHRPETPKPNNKT